MTRLVLLVVIRSRTPARIRGAVTMLLAALVAFAMSACASGNAMDEAATEPPNARAVSESTREPASNSSGQRISQWPGTVNGPADTSTMGATDRDRTQPPADLAELPLAAPGVLGFYVPTQRYAYRELPYMLVLWRDGERDAWALLRLGEAQSVVGVGQFIDETKRAGAFLVRQIEAGRNGGEPRVTGQQRFGSSRAPNRLTLHPARPEESEGSTALGTLLAETGAVHWVRFTGVRVGEGGEAFLPGDATAIFLRTYTVRASTGQGDRRRELAVWPDGTWRLREFAGASATARARERGLPAPRPLVWGGSWKRQGSRYRFVQTLEPDDAVTSVEPWSEFDAVLDPRTHRLWLAALPRTPARDLADDAPDVVFAPAVGATMMLDPAAPPVESASASDADASD